MTSVLNSINQRPKKVAVICVGFIKYDFHAVFALQTAISIVQQISIHQIDRILIINEVRSSPDDRAVLSEHFSTIIVNDANNLARAWNKGMAEAFHRGADYCLIINMDVVLPHNFVDNLVEFAQSRQDLIAWSGITWEDQLSIQTAATDKVLENQMHFSCFMVDQRFLQQVGGFDEQFGPAYHEDSDMVYRLKLLNLDYATTGMAPFYHLDRASLKGAILANDDEFLSGLRVLMDRSMLRYEQKWGGLPRSETFVNPYNK